MKRTAGVLLLCLAAAGCRDNPAQQYGDALIQAKVRSEKKAGHANIQTYQRAIQAFHAANDRYPASLDELSEFINDRIDTELYEYDPSTGSIRPRQ